VNNLRLSQGLSAKIIARSGQRVAYTSPEASTSQSTLNFHGNADGADVFALPNGGYVYASNAELGSGAGGVFGVEFDSLGRVGNYKALLTGTDRNCNGGRTPWNTWVSCEEVAGGQCWQVDPILLCDGGSCQRCRASLSTTSEHSLGLVQSTWNRWYSRLLGILTG
jgi:Bacterial protein of unknown function (DUF839)